MNRLLKILNSLIPNRNEARISLNWLSLRPPNFVSKFTLILSVNKLKKQYQKSKAFWYQQSSIPIPSVQHTYTVSPAYLYQQPNIAIPKVQHSCTNSGSIVAPKVQHSFRCPFPLNLTTSGMLPAGNMIGR